MEGLKNYGDLSIDLRSERDKSVYFWSWVVIYFLMKSSLE